MRTRGLKCKSDVGHENTGLNIYYMKMILPCRSWNLRCRHQVFLLRAICGFPWPTDKPLRLLLRWVYRFFVFSFLIGFGMGGKYSNMQIIQGEEKWKKHWTKYNSLNIISAWNRDLNATQCLNRIEISSSTRTKLKENRFQIRRWTSQFEWHTHTSKNRKSRIYKIE